MSFFKRLFRKDIGSEESIKWPADMTERFTVIRDGKELEVCRLCGKVTDVEANTLSDQRTGYVEGVGQLCDECDKELDTYHRGC